MTDTMQMTLIDAPRRPGSRRSRVVTVRGDQPDLERILASASGGVVIVDSGTEMPLAKMCTTCRAVLPLEAFSLRTGGPAGRQSRCRSCFAAMASTYGEYPTKTEVTWWGGMVAAAQNALAAGGYLGGEHFVYLHGWPGAREHYTGQTTQPGGRAGWNERHKHLDEWLRRMDAVWAVCCAHAEHCVDVALGTDGRVNDMPCVGAGSGPHADDCLRRTF